METTTDENIRGEAGWQGQRIQTRCMKGTVDKYVSGDDDVDAG